MLRDRSTRPAVRWRGPCLRPDARPGAPHAPGESAAPLQPRVFDDVRRGNRGGHLLGQRPAAVLLDADGNWLVAAAVEMLEDRAPRCDRHFMRARSPAVDDADS